MKLTIKSGSALATTAAMLMLSGTVTVSAAEQPMSDSKGHCMGANACKGQSGCKTAANECAGKNGCKGKGFKEMTKAECEKMAGTKFEDMATPEKK